MATRIMAELPKSISPALTFEIVAKCSVTKARSARMTLPHGIVRTPVFMPVGTQGTLKGILPEQVEKSGCRLMLGNTYHLGHRPGADLVEEAGGLHKFMNWKHNLLTDSGGFQMVSLSKLMEVTEDGVKFVSPFTDKEMLLTPEKSIQIQNQLGADIIMQLDDVVHSLTEGPRVEEAMHRTLRWLDRCISAHERPQDQNLFPIVQGALDPELRRFCVQEIIKRNTPGYAIGGLSGGEEKSQFWRMVDISTDYLPIDKPRYLMGVGFAVDLIVCSALGVDMFDCVYPTRTAVSEDSMHDRTDQRFGRALIPGGQITLRNKEFERDHRPIDDQCPCSTCRNYTRSYLNTVATHETIGSHLITIHNVYYMMRLMESIQKNIEENRFPEFCKEIMTLHFPKSDYPVWVVEALKAVNVQL